MNTTKLNELHKEFQKRLNDTERRLKNGDYEYIADIQLEYDYEKAVIEGLENIYNEDDYIEFFKKFLELN